MPLTFTWSTSEASRMPGRPSTIRPRRSRDVERQIAVQRLTIPSSLQRSDHEQSVCTGALGYLAACYRMMNKHIFQTTVGLFSHSLVV